MKPGTITQKMLDSINEPIERVVLDERIPDLAFLEVFGGKYAVHHLTMGNTMKHRFDSIAQAITFLKSKGIIYQGAL